MECGAVIVAGFGFSTQAGEESLRGALDAACQASGRPAVAALATAGDKAPALAPLARALGLPVIALTPPWPATTTCSAASRTARGTGSLAEAAALKAAGPGARLLGPRALSPDRLATCALATGTQIGGGTP